jgi:hypothetical protein
MRLRRAAGADLSYPLRSHRHCERLVSLRQELLCDCAAATQRAMRLMTHEYTRLLRSHRTCWRIERANRLAVIVDAAEYFRHAKAAMLKARHRIMLIGWDFDTRIKFEPDGPELEGPNRPGQFLSWLPKNRCRAYCCQWVRLAFRWLAR